MWDATNSRMTCCLSLSSTNIEILLCGLTQGDRFTHFTPSVRLPYTLLSISRLLNIPETDRPTVSSQLLLKGKYYSNSVAYLRLLIIHGVSQINNLLHRESSSRLRPSFTSIISLTEKNPKLLVSMTCSPVPISSPPLTPLSSYAIFVSVATSVA